MTELLTFGDGNAKLSKRVKTFSLPAGKTCPGALECKSQVVLIEGARRIKDGPQCVFRCFAASQEATYPGVYTSRRRNLELLRSTNDKALLIWKSLPKVEDLVVRIHVSGDYYCQSYFDAWLHVARDRSDMTFYGYTKSLPYVIRRKGERPDNFRLVASVGGRYDDLIEESGLVSATVLRTAAEAKEMGLPVDHDDSLALAADRDFALLIHGTQPKGSSIPRKLLIANGYSNE